MKRLGLFLVALVLVWCGPAKPPPAEVRRPGSTVSGNPAYAQAPDLTNAESFDGSVPRLDAGLCCPVVFAVPATIDDADGFLRVVGHSSEYPLSRAVDGGAWAATACVGLVPQRYAFDVGLNAEGDDGPTVLRTWRINPAVRSEAATIIPAVNVFDPGVAAACADLDAGVYAAVP